MNAKHYKNCEDARWNKLTRDTTMLDSMIPVDQAEVTLAEFFAPFWVYHLELYRRSIDRGWAEDDRS